jgi:hypothetical protein
MFIFLKVSVFPLSWVMKCDIIPNLGRIRMYTSGCPKNQNRCWNRMGFPFPEGSKNDVFMLWSSRIIVIDLASIGKDEISSIRVIMIDHENRFILWILFLLLFIRDDMMLIDPEIDEIPLKWSDKIVELIDELFIVDRGGYSVHPVLILFLVIILIISVIIDGISIHSLRLFSRGKARSGILFMIGMIQFLVLLIVMGIAMKKIIIRACMVIRVLKVELLFMRLLWLFNSIRMIILIDIPIIPDHIPIVMYSSPIVLWLVDMIVFISFLFGLQVH